MLTKDYETNFVLLSTLNMPLHLSLHGGGVGNPLLGGSPPIPPLGRGRGTPLLLYIATLYTLTMLLSPLGGGGEQTIANVLSHNI